MNSSNRITVYLVGFIFGTILVSMIVMRRQARNAPAEDPWLAQQQQVSADGYDPLPAGLPEVMADGHILAFGFLPQKENAEERVWLLNFRSAYPYVRIVENLTSGEIEYMAADQVVLELAPGVDVTSLKPMLDELGLRLRNFNRKYRVAVVGVLHTGIDAVPDTIKALQPWASLFSSAKPDIIILRTPGAP